MIERRLFKSLFLVLITLTLTGCSIHKSIIKEPVVDIPSSYSTAELNTSPPVGRWWEHFGDERLDQLIEYAFRNNLDISQAYERLRQVQALLRITDAAGGPSLIIDASGGRARQTGLSVTNTSDTYALSVAASYEIDLWNRLDAGTEAARFDLLSSEQDLKALYISISARLTDLYYLAVEQRAQLELSDHAIASFNDTLDRVERRYRGGLVPALDVYQARQNLYLAKAQKPLFESKLKETLNALSVIAGRFPEPDIGGDASELIDVPRFSAGLPSKLLTNRPDIQAALFRLKASDERVGVAIADRFPSFNLIGSYGGGGEKIGTVLDSPNIFWNILLQAAQPVLDAGRRKAEVERTVAVFMENLAVYHKTVLNAFREVEDSLTRISASSERIVMLNETVNASENSLRLALDRYMNGLTDYLPVLTEQVRHFTVKSDLLSARRQLIFDTVGLARAIGGEWTDKVFQEYISYKKTGEEEK